MEVDRQFIVVAVEPDGLESAPGALRVYQRKAVDRDTLASAWSDVISGATKPLPATPAKPKAVWESGGVTLTWIAPPQPDIKGYKVWRKKFSGAAALAVVTEPRRQLTAVQVGQGITGFVTAVDADSLESPRSTPLEITAPVSTGEQK